MLENQVAELLAQYLSRFIENVNAEQLEISLWSGNVVLSNVHLRADVLERIAALLHGEDASADDASKMNNCSSSSDAAAAAAQNAASVRMLLSPFTVVKGIICNLTIRVPWSSLESESINVQVSGVELVLGPLRARPFSAGEELEREEAIKQQQLALYEEERQRLSREVASEITSRSSSVQPTGGQSFRKEKNTRAAAHEDAVGFSAGAWFSWIWDFDRISQMAVRNICVTLKDVCLRYEFDYEGLHPTFAKAFSIFVREVRLTTTNQRFREKFVSDLLSPICKKVLFSDIVVSTHAVRLHANHQTKKEARSFREGSPQPSSFIDPLSYDGETGRINGNDIVSSQITEDSGSTLQQAATMRRSKTAYETYEAQWCHSQAVLQISKVEVQAKIVPLGCTSLHPTVEDAPLLPASSTELMISAVEGVHAEICFGVFQTLGSMWRSYHQNLGCARYRKRLHLLRLNKCQDSQLQRSEPICDTVLDRDTSLSKSGEASPQLFATVTVSTSRQLARRRWQFALRCVLDDIQQQRQTFHRHDRSRREVIEGMMQFCLVRRTYCQYWKRAQGVPWAPPLDTLEEKKLTLLERQLSLSQVLFLRCLSYAEMLLEEDGYARQRAFIEEARQRKQKATGSSRNDIGSNNKQSAEGHRTAGLWGWFTKPSGQAIKVEKVKNEDRSTMEGNGEARQPFVLSPRLQAHTLSNLLAAEWDVGQRYAAPHRAPLAQPPVPQSLLPEVTEGNPLYLTLRCLLNTLTLRVDPTYWPLPHDSSVSAPPMHTPLRRISQQFCVRLSAVEVFFTTVPDDRPDKASWSFFVGSVRITFEGTLRSVLLQSKEAEGEDFVVVKENACRTQVGVWIAPQLIICQPLHEWRWWGIEMAAFVNWFKGLVQSLYTPIAPASHPAGAAAAAAAAALTTPASLVLGGTHLGTQLVSCSSHVMKSTTPEYTTLSPRRSPQPPHDDDSTVHGSPAIAATVMASTVPPLEWNVTLQAIDVCFPLFSRDIDDRDLDIINHQPSGLSSLVMMDTVTTAVPLKCASFDYGIRHTSPLGAGEKSKAEKQPQQLKSPAAHRGGARSNGALHAFRSGEDYGDDVEGVTGKQCEADEACEEGCVKMETLSVSAAGSFASTKPERCFLNSDSCLVLTISTSRLCTVAPSQKRHGGAGSEYYLCIGDPDRAVRLFYQEGLSPATVGVNRHLELVSFAAGEMLLNPEELSIVFNKGIDFVVEPGAFAALNDGLLKPEVFSRGDMDARVVQDLANELQQLSVGANTNVKIVEGCCCNTGVLRSGQLPPRSWRLRSPGCIEIVANTRVSKDGTDVTQAVVVRDFPKDCTRHIMTAVLPTLICKTTQQNEKAKETKSGDVTNNIFGGRKLALGVSVARLLVRSVYNEDLAEVVLVAPEEVPLVTAPYRDTLATLGAREPRAVELVWSPTFRPFVTLQDGQLNSGRPLPPTEQQQEQNHNANPTFLLSVPDITMTTAAGQKLVTIEQLTIVQARATPDAAPGIAVTVEEVSTCFDMVLVDLVEVAIGAICALRPTVTPLRPKNGAVTVVAKAQNNEEQIQQGNPADPVPKLSLWVRSIHLQTPLTKSGMDGAPYVEINAHLDGFSAALEPALQSSENQISPTHQGHRVHVEFKVPDAVHLIDYIGGDPEVRSLVTSVPWAAANILFYADRREVQPLRCAVDLLMLRARRNSSSNSGNNEPTALLPITTCKIDVCGGVLHAYFPFLYLFLQVWKKDGRIQRLKRLPSSPLFQRGFTAFPCELEQWRKDDGTSPSAFSVPTTTFVATSAATKAPFFFSAPSCGPIEATVTVSNMAIFLATDAAVPIDACNPDTVCIVHVAEVKAGLTRTLAKLSDPSLSTRLRTSAYFNTVSLHLVDLTSLEPNHVQLPNLKVRADAGVLLVPKESLTGYTYRRGDDEDLTVLVGLHPPVLPFTETVSEINSGTDEAKIAGGEGAAAGAAGEVPNGADGLTGISVDLNASQCRTLIRFFARNVAQGSVAIAQGVKAWDVNWDVCHSLSSCTKYPTRSPQPDLATSMDDVAVDRAPPPNTHPSVPPPLLPTTAATTPALTLLVTIPSVSLVLRTGETVVTAVELKSSSDMEPGKYGITYEFALRRGAQFYSASGGQWFNSPVKNGQMSGLELNAREVVQPGVTAPLAGTRRVKTLFTADVVELALLGINSSPTSSVFRSFSPREKRETAAREDEGTAKSNSNDGVNDSAGGVGAPFMRAAAAVRNTTVQVPHVQWWLRLYSLFADSVATVEDGASRLDSTPLTRSPALPSVQGSFVGAGAFSNMNCKRTNYASGAVQRYRNNVSSQQSGSVIDTRDDHRSDYCDNETSNWSNSSNTDHRPRFTTTTAQVTRWVYGSLELTQVQLTLGDSTSSSSNASQQQQQNLPWCRLLIPEARLTVLPVSLPQSAGARCVYDELTLVVPRCPELLLRSVATKKIGENSNNNIGTTSNNRDSKVVYVSVLKFQPVAPTRTASNVPKPSTSASPCIQVQLIRSPDAHCTSNLRYGRSYRVKELALHRTRVVQVQVRGLLLDVPANELFSFAHELRQQSQEVRTLFAPTNDRAPCAAARSVGPSRTYTDLEVQLTNVGVIITSESPRANPTAGKGSPPPAADDLPWCGVTVASIRLTTNVELENVITNTGEPTTLIDDTLSVGWRVRVFHLVSNVALRGVVVAGHYGTRAQWKLPSVSVIVSKPLQRTVLCVRAERYTVVESGVGQPDCEPPSLVLHQRSPTHFFRVEPTAADVCSELNSHLLTSVLVEVGDDVIETASGKATKSGSGKLTDTRAVVVSVNTAYLLSRCVMHLLNLWRVAEQQSQTGIDLTTAVAAVKEGPTEPYVNAQSLPLQMDESPDTIMWYEVKLSLRGRRVNVVSDIPDNAPHNASRVFLMAITLDGSVTFQAERELMDNALIKAEPRFGCSDDGESEEENHNDEDSMGSAGAMLIAMVRQRYRVRVDTTQIRDSAGNLIALFSSENSSKLSNAFGAASYALAVEYIATDNALSVVAGHIWLGASLPTAAFVVELFRSCQTWTQMWTKAQVTSATTVEQEKPDTDSSPFVQVFAEVFQMEVQLAPAGCVVLKRPRLSRTQNTTRALTVGVAASAAEKVLEVQCDAIALHSTSAVGRGSAQQTRKTDLLASIALPLLRQTCGAGASAMLCRVPTVLLYNRDRHSWALCAMRAASCFQSAVALWSSTSVDASATSVLLAAAVGEEKTTSLSTPRKTKNNKKEVFAGASEVVHRSTCKLMVVRAELLCFTPEEEQSDSDGSPALHLHAEGLNVTLPGLHFAVRDSTKGEASSEHEVRCHAQVTLSASYHAAAEYPTEQPLLDKTEVTVAFFSQPQLSEERVTEAAQAAESEMRISVAEHGLQLHLPTHDALDAVASALWLAVGQHVPRRSSSRSMVPPYSAAKNSSHDSTGNNAGKTTDEKPNSNEKAQRWCVSASMPLVSCDFTTGNEGQRLAAVAIKSLYGKVQLRAAWQRSFVELRIAEITGETDVSDTEAMEEPLFTSAETASESGASTSTHFLSIKSLTGGAQTKASRSLSPSEWGTAAPAEMQHFAIFLEQKFLSLSHSDQSEHGSTTVAACVHDDAAAALTVRLHRLHTYITLAFLKAISRGVLKPIVAGLRRASAAEVDEAVVKSFHSTVLKVNHPTTPLPPLGELERHASLVRVVEVMSDWTLTHDLVLGGPMDSCSLQLHFRNTASHNVITVRGDPSAAAEKGDVTVYLSCCESVNGDLGPAIRVDSDVTVKFERVRVVVGNLEKGCGGEPETVSPDAFVMLGERALCFFPTPPLPDSTPAKRIAQEDLTEEVTEKEVEETLEAGPVETKIAAVSSCSLWPVTSVYSVDVKVGFDATLAAQRRSLRAAGTWKMRYRFEDKRKGNMSIRTEREGEATLTLQQCNDDTGALTHTPTAFVAHLGYANKQESRVELTFDLGSRLWRLPVGHGQLLLAVARCVTEGLESTPSTRAEPRSTFAAKAAAVRAAVRQSDESLSTVSAWVQPAAFNTNTQTVKTKASAPTLLDVKCEVPLFTLYITDDLLQPLVACNVEKFWLTCTSDVCFTDAVINAAASLYITDRLHYSIGFRKAVEGESNVSSNTASTAVQTSLSTSTTHNPSRILFAARPSMTLAWTRFSADSRSLSLSVTADDVVATLPITTALRALRRAHMEVDTGTRAFWNDTGVDLAIAAVCGHPTPFQSCAEANHVNRVQWRVPASSSGGTAVVVTGLSSTVPELTLTPQSTYASSAAASAETGAALCTDHLAALQPVTSIGVSLFATLDLRKLEHDAVHRLQLPQYVSPLGALDIVVRKCVRDNREVLHLATTVEVTNVFYPPHDTDSGAAVTLRTSASDTPAFVIMPRSTRFIPLPILQDRFAIEMDGCAYGALARLLTWAMLADAMTVMADQIAACCATGTGGNSNGSSTAAASVAASLRTLGLDTEKGDSEGGGRHKALIGRQVQVRDSSTVSFPVLLRPLPPSVAGSTKTPVSLTNSGGRTDDSIGSTGLQLHTPSLSQIPAMTRRAQHTSRVVQITWKRHCSRQQQQLLFSGRLPPCEYTVKVEPVWTLWNCTGCRMRLRVRRPSCGDSVATTQEQQQGSTHSEKTATTETFTNVFLAPKPSVAGDIIGTAVIENGACFQWVPTSLSDLDANIAVFFQIEAPFTHSTLPTSPQWWSAVAPLSLKELPPPYLRLQQGFNNTQGAVSLERHGSSTVVVRCAAVLKSDLLQCVYLRDASRPRPLLGTDAQGCLRPQQVLPLFFSEYVTTLAPHAKRVGFAVRDKPLRGDSIDEKEETDPYYVTTPVAATVLSADKREDCTVFYSVSATKGAEAALCDATTDGAGLPESSSSSDASLWRPAAPTVLQLRCLCSIHNKDPHRMLFVRPYVEENDSHVARLPTIYTEETCIPPGATREVLRFSAHADEPEVQFCYGAEKVDGERKNDATTTAVTLTHAHLWSPPVKLLSLATSTLPLVLKHVCVPTSTPATAAELDESAFHLFPVPHTAHEAPFSVMERCHCFALQSSTDDGRLRVSVSLRFAPPLRIINRLSTTLEFSQALEQATGSSSPATVSAKSVSTALCSRTAPPWSYLVAAESNSFGCWEVPTLKFQGLCVTLHSNRRKGFTASADVNLLKRAATPSSGLRVGQTDAYIYVSLNHSTHQYTVTVVPRRRLENRTSFQPRRLTQLEVLVPRCTLYVAAITLPTTGPFSRMSVVACGARGRLRSRPGVGGCTGGGGDGGVVPPTATDEDLLTLLRQLEVDVACVRLVGGYSSVMATERHLLGNASVSIVEVVDCTIPEATYPVVFRMSSINSDGSQHDMSSERQVAAKTNSSGGDGESVSAAEAGAAGVPRFRDPSWCSMEVQLTRSTARFGGGGGNGADLVMVPIQQLRVVVPPLTVHLHDEFLFTVRTSVESIREELEATPMRDQDEGNSSSSRLSGTVPSKGSVSGEMVPGGIPTEAKAANNADGTGTRPGRGVIRTVYNVFLYEMHISAIVMEVTYTRTGERRCNPFRNLGVVPAHLIPSLEGLSIKLNEVHLINVELLSVTSLAKVMQSFVWPLYRTQLLLQSYKVIGSLDFLGNPRALLSSWSRGVWDLVTNASGKSRWAGTRDFLRTTTSSTLHSVGVLARSIGNLTGGSSTAAAFVVNPSLSSASRDGVLYTTVTAAAGLHHRIISEILSEVSGGVADAVMKPLRGAREDGVNGFFVGMASGMVDLVGRPMFGFLRGVSVTSEFYARLLGGQTTLTAHEARRLALERNYRLADIMGVEEAEGKTAAAAVASAASATAAVRFDAVPLATAKFEQLMADIPQWRRTDKKNVRAAVARVGVCNAALFIPYSSTSAFMSPGEFAASLPTSLTALLTAKLLFALTHTDLQRSSTAADYERYEDTTGKDASDENVSGQDGANNFSSSNKWLTRLARDCDRASHIKASLGVTALNRYVSGDALVRVCSLAELNESVTATSLQANYVVSLAKAVNAAAEELFVLYATE